jgi:predicted RNase H-like HicB family nuclease
MDICNEHGKTHRGDPAHPDDCVVCRLERLENELAAERERREKAEANYQWMVEHAADNKLDGYRELGQRAAAAEARANRLRERLNHALAALRHIARTCIEDPDTAQFASRASDEQPSALAPKEDYQSERLTSLMSLPWENEYRLLAIPEDDGGGFCAFIPLFGEKGCRADGDTPEDAIGSLRNVLAGVIAEYLERGWKVPTPSAFAPKEDCDD